MRPDRDCLGMNPRARFSFRALLGWLPFALLAVATFVGWRAFVGGGMPSVLGWLALLSAVPALALVVGLGTIIRTARTQRNAPRFVATMLLAAFCLWPAGWNVGIAAIAFPIPKDRAMPAATVRLPTDAPMRVLWGGDDLAHNQHAMFPDQRWAYDLGIAPVLVGSKRLEDYGCWGVPVVAPASAKVHIAHDGEPDQEPGTLSSDPAHALGNHVVLELASGGYLVLAHLRRGSVVAREGEPIAEGAPIGACGNSGHTSEPHVHLHAQRQDPRGRPVNYAEGLPVFFRDHDGAPMPEGGIAIVKGRATATGAVVRHAGDQARAMR